MRKTPAAGQRGLVPTFSETQRCPPHNLNLFEYDAVDFNPGTPSEIVEWTACFEVASAGPYFQITPKNTGTERAWLNRINRGL